MALPIRSILVSQPAPTDASSPYFQLEKELGVKFSFHSFVKVEGITTSDFRKQNINPLDFTAIIFVNRFAIDQYFKICKELRIEMPVETKYFCVSEATAKYLQKYIVIRKRKLYVGEKKVEDLVLIAKKHAKERFLFPAGDTNRSEVVDLMEAINIKVKFAMVYQTVPSDVRDVLQQSYDMMCFFSPAQIESLYHNAPDFQQGDTFIAVFGELTAKAAESHGLNIHIRVPAPGLPSMTMGIEQFIKEMAKTES
jgi:uroporphyrinogen-III synthase